MKLSLEYFQPLLPEISPRGAANRASLEVVRPYPEEARGVVVRDARCPERLTENCWARALRPCGAGVAGSVRVCCKLG